MIVGFLMSKSLLRAIEDKNLDQVRHILDQDPEAVRRMHNVSETPSTTLGRKVISALEWAILRRSVGAVDLLLTAAPLNEHGRDPDAPVTLLLEILGDDWAEVHLPDRDRYPTVRDALPPPSGMTPAMSLRAIGAIAARLDKAGVDWLRPHGTNGRLRLDHLDLHPDSPAHALLSPIVNRERAKQSLADRQRRRIGTR
jgi:hypothetical protein